MNAYHDGVLYNWIRKNEYAPTRPTEISSGKLIQERRHGWPETIEG